MSMPPISPFFSITRILLSIPSFIFVRPSMSMPPVFPFFSILLHNPDPPSIPSAAMIMAWLSISHFAAGITAGIIRLNAMGDMKRFLTTQKSTSKIPCQTHRLQV
ncbi:hypothetical protein C1H46_005992 [Malus baccata]|uniref:Uncharacterized protein n=1 Tax=Malus baccata TaxID=106549 RepID=A0A540NBF9_MALBA|nr:hypothetical protein C1H46_005992 [Malus baccata]